MNRTPSPCHPPSNAFVWAVLAAAVLGFAWGQARAVDDEVELIPLSVSDLPGFATSVAVSGRYAYVGYVYGDNDMDSGVEVIDISDRARPQRVGRLRLGTGGQSHVSRVVVHNDDVYLLDRGDLTRRGVVILSAADPIHLQNVGIYHTGDYPSDLVVVGNYGYLVGQGFGVVVLDLSNRANPSRLGGTTSRDTMGSVDVMGSYLCGLLSMGGLRVFDISRPNEPRLVGQYDADYGQFGLSEGHAFLALHDRGFRVIDLKDPTHPQEMGGCCAFTQPSDAVVSGQRAYVSDAHMNQVYQVDYSDLHVIDISNPAQPRRTGGHRAATDRQGLAVSAPDIFVAAGASGLEIIRVIPRLTVVSHPQPVSVYPGDDANFAVTILGSEPLRYQWRKNGGDVPGATQSSLFLTNVQAVDKGAYDVVVSDAYRAVTSTVAQLTVLPLVRFPTNEVLVTTLAGSGSAGFSDGQGQEARFDSPNAGFADTAGRSYLADTRNHRIRRVTPQGVVTTVAGSGVAGYSDGPAASSRFSSPLGVCVDDAGNVYVADTGNNRIRKISATGDVSTVAGDGNAGLVNGPGATARFNFPNDVVVDRAGCLFVTEFNNHTVRKITPNGEVSTWVGDGIAGSLDGPRAQARLNAPGGIAIDGRGRLYLAEWGGHRIRKVSEIGIVGTLAGDGEAGYRDGEAARARFRNPDGIVVNDYGLVLVADNGNHAMRWITPAGLVETVAGTGQAGLVNGPGREARFTYPSGVGTSEPGDLYVADAGTHTLREIRISGFVAIPRELTVPNELLLRLAIEKWGEVKLSFDGTLWLSQPLVIDQDTVLDGSGYEVTLSGNQQVRLIEVRTNAHLTLNHLTLTAGLSDRGGALINDGGSVTLVSCTFSNHQALGVGGILGSANSNGLDSAEATTLTGATGGPAMGGAIFSIGPLLASNCLFVANLAQGGAGERGRCVPAHETNYFGRTSFLGGIQGDGGQGGWAGGGAIYLAAGLARFLNCTFQHNVARGGAGGDAPACRAGTPGMGGGGGDGFGGAVFGKEGRVEWLNCLLDTNEASGGTGGAVGNLDAVSPTFNGDIGSLGDGGRGGAGLGGAIYTHSSLHMDACSIRGNRAAGAAGGRGGTASFPNDNPSASATYRVGFGGPGGDGDGGALWADGPVTSQANAWVDNRATGGPGAPGGQGTRSGTVQFQHVTYGIASRGGSGGTGGLGRGGAWFMRAGGDSLNETVARNEARGGLGGDGGTGGGWSDNRFSRPLPGGDGGRGGNGFGGGIFSSGLNLHVVHATVAENRASVGPGGTGGSGPSYAPGSRGSDGPAGDTASGGGILGSAGSVALANSIVAASMSGGNLAGSIVDGGHNLSSDLSLALTNSGSRVNTAPRLGTLGDYGGPTPTFALLADSPALDSADPALCPADDQRRAPRPNGKGCDIGAFEGEGLEAPRVMISARSTTAGVGDILLLDLELQNPNGAFAISNLTGQISLPAGLLLKQGFLQFTNLTLSPGESLRRPLTVQVVRLGQHPVGATFRSSLTGDQSVVQGVQVVGSGPPEILTSWARWQGAREVSLEGLAIPQGVASMGWFRYGLNTNLEFKSVAQPVAPSFEPETIRASLTLASAVDGVTYRMVVSNAFGVVEGPIQKVTPAKELTRCQESDLRAAVSTGGYVRLACDGIFALSQSLRIATNVVLDAQGYDLSISGRGAVRVLEVAAGAELTLIQVKVVEGFSATRGAGLENAGGTVRVIDGAFFRNRVSGPSEISGRTGGAAEGGAIHNAGLLVLDGSRLEQNIVRGGDGWGTSAPDYSPTSGGEALGGAIAHASGSLLLRQCTALGNQALGGIGGSARENSGMPEAASGGNGGPGRGGVIWHAGTRLWVQASTLESNSASGGRAGMRGWVQVGGGQTNGLAGPATGGAIDSQGELLVVGSLLAGNRIIGGAGIPGDYEGASAASPSTLRPSQPGGEARGAALASRGDTVIANSTFAWNSAVPGSGGTAVSSSTPSPLPGSSSGGGLYVARGSTLILNATLVGNEAATGADLDNTGGNVQLANCILAGNAAFRRVAGPLVDLGSNLATAPDAPLDALSSLRGNDPRLLPLADNGGPVMTLALAADSPAIDAGNDTFSAAPDARGFPRPSGFASDIGAYEFQAPPVIQSATAWLKPDGAVQLRFVVWPNAKVALETTSDWVTWHGVLTNATDEAGVFEAVDSQVPQHRWRMFRLRKE
ncbi:MAG: hypothetical protein JNK85_10405 [Verrucomicrobiales bacterium]|nr:hypothetical protein [Verrucomicrobiales bacterium]